MMRSAVLQRLQQNEAARPAVEALDAGRQRVLFEGPHHVNADALIAHDDVAEPEHERLIVHASSLPQSLFPLVLRSLDPCSFHPVELPSADDRGHGAAALDVVVIEGKINVNDDERDKEPQERWCQKRTPKSPPISGTIHLNMRGSQELLMLE